VQREFKEFLAAAGIVSALVVGGANLIATGHPDLGSALLVAAVVLLALAIGWFFWWPWYVRRRRTWVVEWLVRCGNVGTDRFFNAVVQSPEEAKALRAAYETWHHTLVEGVDWYCLPSDANKLRFLDMIQVGHIKDSGPGWGDGHTKRMAADTVQRIRDLSVRLDQEQTRLRRIKRPPPDRSALGG
jgi:hypothetical protein